MNTCIIIGNCGADPDIKRDGDTPRGRVRVAVTRKWTDRDSGEKREKTEWFNVVFFGNQVEAASYLRKGSHVCIVGRIETRKYEADNKVEHYVTELIAERIEFLGPAPSAATSSAPAAQTAPKQAQAVKPAAAPAPQQPNYRDDVPF